MNARQSAQAPPFDTVLLALSALAALGGYSARAADVTHTGQPIKSFDQSWFFDWTTAGSPVPVIEQCGILDVTWSRGAAQGPSANAPYYMQIYTSTYITPFVIDVGNGQEYQWPVPFAPNTTFQICMFDKNGNTGGCQRTMTVIPNYNDSTPSCPNITFPRPNQLLQVDASDSIGPLSQYGWPAQCTDLSFTPKNGSAPYTLTIAPTLHPPYNITVNSTGTTVNWTIDQTWGSQFFVSLTDSAGNGWSNGPLHAGKGTFECLTGGSSSPKKDNTVSTVTAIGAGVGGGVGGILIGLLAAFFIYRCVHRRRPQVTGQVPSTENVPVAGVPVTGVPGPETMYTSPTLVTGAGGRQQGYEPWKESWAVSSEGRSSLTASPNPGRYDTRPMSSLTQPVSPPATATSFGADSHPRGGNSVYVVHHDGGRPPVSVYADNGTQVVELPPGYAGRDASGSDGPLNQRRLPNLPTKS